MVQPDQGIRVHSARSGRKGRIRPHFGSRKAGLTTLNEGAKVSYDVVANRGKESAENLHIG